MESALAAVDKHFEERSATAHKERVDLMALKKHTGELYAQVESIPADVYARVRKLQGTAPLVLLPPNSAGEVGPEAVVMFTDAHGAVKGLPNNPRATMLLKACGMADDGATCVADVLVTNDLRGNESHGCSNMLREYVRWLRCILT